MAKLTLANLVNLNNQTAACATINSNSDLIETALENTLSRDGTSPNSMGADLDMNSNQILNLPAATLDTEPVRKGEFDAAIGGIVSVGVAPDTITNIYLVNMAESTIKGRAAGVGTGDPQDLTATQVATIVDSFFLTPAEGNAAYQPLDSTLTSLAAYSTNGLVTQTAADTFTGRTITGTANEITATNGNGVSGNPTLSLPTALTFTGKTVTGGSFSSPTLTTPVLGTPTSGTLTNCTGLPIAGLVASTSTAIGVGSIELGAASDTTISRSAAGVIAVEGVPIFSNIPQNSQSTAYTTVLADAQKHIFHPTADNNARTFTIDSNANVAYPIGTAITFINQINTITIAITSDTMTLAGAGTTGSRTLAANGIATAIKIATTSWIISGTGLT